MPLLRCPASDTRPATHRVRTSAVPRVGWRGSALAARRRCRTEHRSRGIGDSRCCGKPACPGFLFLFAAAVLIGRHAAAPTQTRPRHPDDRAAREEAHKLRVPPVPCTVCAAPCCLTGRWRFAKVRFEPSHAFVPATGSLVPPGGLCRLRHGSVFILHPLVKRVEPVLLAGGLHPAPECLIRAKGLPRGRSAPRHAAAANNGARRRIDQRGVNDSLAWLVRPMYETCGARAHGKRQGRVHAPLRPREVLVARPPRSAPREARCRQGGISSCTPASGRGRRPKSRRV